MRCKHAQITRASGCLFMVLNMKHDPNLIMLHTAFSCSLRLAMYVVANNCFVPSSPQVSYQVCTQILSGEGPGDPAGLCMAIG